MSQEPQPLSPDEKERYLRQLAMADWSEEDQLKLKGLHITVMGIGGAASSIINNLLLLGVGRIEAIDQDTVELSNLNRQFIHNVDRIGMSKAESLKIYAQKLNPHVEVIAKEMRVDEGTIEKAVDPKTDLIIDTFDKWAFRSIVNRFAVGHRIPYLMAGVVSNCFYTALLHSPRTPCLNCLIGRFQSPSVLGTFQSATFGINILPIAAMGAFSVAELIKYLKTREVTNQFYFGSLYATKQDIRFFSLFLSKHFRKISEEQGIQWGPVWDQEGIIRLKLSRDPSCRVCGRIS
ncbi:MAG: HesA/MoeB/ThiF family protein [Syntrophaceae bacterium]|nr:HesA/MoeB/ThiF family protein [Syntrophaceae bacterium]